ncbi:hypothetical protein RQP46_005291 [Phenoliferia psychrophenolica]
MSLSAANSPSAHHSAAHTPTSEHGGSTGGGGGAAFSSLQHAFEQQQQGQGQSPANGGGDFADLLAEFTLPGNMLSPEAIAARSPPPTGPALDLLEQQAQHNGQHSRRFSTNGQSFGESQDGFDYQSSSHGARHGQQQHQAQGGGGGGAGQLADAIANMDSATQGQLLAALLARQQNGTGAVEAQQLEHALALHAAFPPSSQPPPLSSSTSSAVQSPAQPFQHYDQNQNQQLLFQQHLQQQYHLAAALNASLPPSHASSPLASPYYGQPSPQPNQYFPDGPPSSAQQQHAAGNGNGNGFPAQFHPHDSQAANSGGTTTPGGSAQNFHHAFSPQPNFGGPQHTSQPADVQALLAMDVLARTSGPAPYPGVAGDMRIRGGSATGGSYATTNGENEDWGDNDFMFSPLMSPALTPHSTFSSVASSLPPSAQSCLPNQANLNGIAPGDFFSPLGSPAILPQSFSSHPHSHPQLQQQQQQQQQGWPAAHHGHSNSLQGLVDQTRALAFDVNGFHAAPGSPAYSPTSMSPRLGPVDAGQSTATGSGRRGAGGKKARPSPLLKPTPDSAVRRKKAPERRSSSIGSTGARSATTSPFLGPSTSAYGSGLIAPLSSSKGPSSTSANGQSTATRTSPPEHSSGSNNTPSPVDLAMMLEPSPASNELMGPPPPPSTSSATSSRRGSLQSSAGAPTGWMNPVTPASFMNFPADISAAGLAAHPPAPSGLARRPPQDHDQQQQDDSGSTAGPSSKSKSKKVVLLPSVQRREVDEGRPGATAASSAKGKGRSASVSSSPASAPPGARKIGSKPIAKAPAAGGAGPKIKPLLASGLPPDALSRLSTKSNYQNIMDGRGVDLLGLDPSTVSALNATQGAGADNRRTSHKAAEQKRRDSLKLCFEELRRILPPIAASAPDEEKRPGEGNVGGQRGGSVDPENPNRGVSKVALLRRSNEYVGMLHDRIDRRDFAVEQLRMRLRDARSRLGEDLEEDDVVDGLDLDNIDRDERAAGTMAFYECLDSDDEQEVKPKPQRKPPAGGGRRKSIAAADGEFKGKLPGGATGGARRSTRRSFTSQTGNEDDSESAAMDVEDGGE